MLIITPKGMMPSFNKQTWARWPNPALSLPHIQMFRPKRQAWSAGEISKVIAVSAILIPHMRKEVVHEASLRGQTS